MSQRKVYNALVRAVYEGRYSDVRSAYGGLFGPSNVEFNVGEVTVLITSAGSVHVAGMCWLSPHRLRKALERQGVWPQPPEDRTLALIEAAP